MSSERAHAEEEAPAANIWIDASSWTSCPGMESLPASARVIAQDFPKTEWRPDIYFAMEQVEKEAHGKVAMRYLGQELFKKEVKAETCSEVIAALLLSLQIYVDEVKSPDLPQIEEETLRGRQRGAPPGWPGPDLDPFAVAPSEGDPFGRGAPVEPKALTWRPALYVGFVQGYNLLPNSVWGSSGAEITGTIPLDEHIGFDGGARFLTSLPLDVGGYRYHFSSTTFFVGPSRSIRLSNELTLRLNFSAMFSIIHASVASGNLRAASPPFPSVGTLLNAVLSLNPFDGLLLEVKLGGQALSLNGVYLGPNDETVWEQPLAGAFGGVSVGWGGEKVKQKQMLERNVSGDELSPEGSTSSEQ